MSLQFFDVGAVVYYAKIITWEYPNFSVEGCCDRLLKLDEEIQKIGYIEGVQYRFFLVAQKR